MTNTTTTNITTTTTTTYSTDDDHHETSSVRPTFPHVTHETETIVPSGEGWGLDLNGIGVTYVYQDDDHDGIVAVSTITPYDPDHPAWGGDEWNAPHYIVGRDYGLPLYSGPCVASAMGALRALLPS